MQVIKRDGHYVDYDREKIKIAIEKANNEVSKKEKISKEDIKEICHYIESLNKKRILVEDIQDIIEIKLMEYEKYELAKRYIVYRYNRALIRKSNTTDESILSLIKNSNRESSEESKNTLLACTGRDYIAGEVSRDLSKRILLPEKIRIAHEKGILHFHALDYFVQPIFNSSLINIEDMLDNGTIINGIKIPTPDTFHNAINTLIEIIMNVYVNQYGSISLEIRHLAKYLKKSFNLYKDTLNKKYNKLDNNIINELLNDKIKEELHNGIKYLLKGINTLLVNGHKPDITFFLYLKDDEYIKENALIIEEIFNESINNEYNLPKLVYVLDEINNLNGNSYDYLTELALNIINKNNNISFISAKIMKEKYFGNVFSPIGDRGFLSLYKEDGNYKFEGRFNQGVVTLNLPQIGIIADGDIDKFWMLLDERLDLCYEALMCRYYALLGVTSDISPIHWQNGAIARLKEKEIIDKYLKDGYSTLSLGYIGLYELTKLVKSVSITSDEGIIFAKKVLEYMRNKCNAWNKETGICFQLYGIKESNVSNRFSRLDLEQFGKIKDITDKGYYIDSHHIDKNEKIDIFSKLEIENELGSIATGGSISYINLSNSDTLKEMIKYIYDNVLYSKIYIGKE